MKIHADQGRNREEERRSRGLTSVIRAALRGFENWIETHSAGRLLHAVAVYRSFTSATLYDSVGCTRAARGTSNEFIKEDGARTRKTRETKGA